VVFRRWAELDPDRPIRPWLFGVARRVAAGMRRKDRETPVERVDTAVAAPDRTADAERDLLWRALAQLDEDRRLVIVLHDLDGWTGADIARELAISVNTV